ncbi:hypothetical protein [Pedobacter sp. SYP-B3415]|uniref:hypothetical protein n=1 Tax=Pedobacter sp. SYP-B3415 TaxID=2496641 RepID=UPI00101CD171|nr:hypothetical protein [Pedobacter sp. SYP-B3415]
MSGLRELRKRLKKGKVYRRADLEKWTGSVDRLLAILVEEGTLQKLSTGVYYFPKESVFGPTPADEKELVRTFLKDSRFLLTSPNSYNTLGVGTTQLYNKKIVYNHKRHGEFKLGNKKFDFQIRHHFPARANAEFLIIDLINNLDKLAEDTAEVLKKVQTKIREMDKYKLKKSLEAYGNLRTKRLLSPMIS